MTMQSAFISPYLRNSPRYRESLAARFASQARYYEKRANHDFDKPKGSTWRDTLPPAIERYRLMQISLMYWGKWQKEIDRLSGVSHYHGGPAA